VCGYAVLSLNNFILIIKDMNNYIWILVFNATFSNISAISWRPVLMVEEAGVPGVNPDPGQANGKLYHLRLRVECTLVCNSWNIAESGIKHQNSNIIIHIFDNQYKIVKWKNCI
jgi:hypothetical protein